ncbi:iron-sulfur cluster assembly scaffold protein [Pseudolysinimonas sp.]|uniref:iron-sulfur cluster assembly scaffold protein n=1 Tax=Pseudolysinimonas sp. TaxID=2680009 RepID=UPI00286A2109|nr:iron-sulfur cluster assembly scaffold protein [Pseudolysinimonas sp.]
MLAEADRATLIEELATARVGAGLGDLRGLEAHRRSPACGDDVRVRVVLQGDLIADLRWEGHGCVVSTAAASALAATASSLAVAEFRALTARYLATLDSGAAADPDLGDLEAFAGIGRYPLRAGCASLSWRAALDALHTDT